MSFQRGQAQIISEISTVQRLSAAWQKLGRPVTLVPTGELLHIGYLGMVEAARALAQQPLLILATRMPAAEIAAKEQSHLQTLGVDIIFSYQDARLNSSPNTALNPVSEQPGFRTQIHPISHGLEDITPQRIQALSRMVRLLGILRPTNLVLGERDYEEIVDIQQAITDLYLPTKVHISPVRRTVQGIPINPQLNLAAAEEEKMLFLAAAISAGQAVADKGAAAVLAATAEILNDAGLTPDYLDLRSWDLAPLLDPGDPRARLIAAIPLNQGIRAIDSAEIPLGVAPQSPPA
ncbi:pantoate--beta-alanine ligase [Corynebacterium caspium]|uniref:pantoate--beta-alanine ligase n=1 Tax=Corynebacterium caspium TaxID=234828 RepID=UPI000369D073|nr:pantoate--beta-alanine ligase [Corynebacterium caspium]WKD58699.1 Pantothenate synthetase [Corynebacterium caspium DSM 44850]